MEKTLASTGAARIAAAASVIVIMISTLWHALGGPAFLFALTAAAAAVLIDVEYRNIPSRLRNAALTLFAASIAVLPFAREPLAAVQRGVQVAGLMVSLMASVMLLALCALRSEEVRVVGAYLRRQRPGRRYFSFTLASQLFSAMLGMAGVNIMLVMAAPAGEPKSADRTERVIAVTRGFSAASFWSPVYGNMAILLALYPSLRWIEVFPLGVVLAQFTILAGMLMHHAGRGTAQDTVPESGPEPEMARAAAPLIAVMAGYLGLLLASSSWLGISISTAIVLLGPLVALALNIALADRGRRVAEGMRRMRDGLLQFPGLANEAILFAAAGCAGSILAAAFPVEWVRQAGHLLAGFPLFGIAFLMFAIMGMALAGLHPVLSAVFMASTMTPQALDLPPITHIAAILMGWGLSSSVTPFSVLSLTASRYSGNGLYQISIGKNWAFALLTSLVACAVLTVATLALR